MARSDRALVTPGALFGVVQPTRSMSITSLAEILMHTIVKILSYREHCLGVDSVPGLCRNNGPGKATERTLKHAVQQNMYYGKYASQ